MIPKYYSTITHHIRNFPIMKRTKLLKQLLGLKNITRKLFLLAISSNDLSYLDSTKETTDAWIAFENNFVRSLIMSEDNQCQET